MDQEDKIRTLSNTGKSINILVASTPQRASLIESTLESAGSDLHIQTLETKSMLDKAFQQNQWHLIFSDLEVADFTALDIAQRKDAVNPDIPILLISATGSEFMKLRCLEEGIGQFIELNDTYISHLPTLVASTLKRAQKAYERRHSEYELVVSSERYRDVFDNTSDLIQCLSPAGDFLYTNSAWRKAMGYTEEEVLSLNLLDVLHPESMLCCQDRFERLKQGEELSCIQFKFIAKSGETVHLSGDCGSIIKDGEAISTRGIFRNVTEMARAEEALRASEARYQTLYENAPDINTTINPSGEILSINRFGARMLGYAVDELVGESVAKLIHPEDQAAVFAYSDKKFNDPMSDSGIEYRCVRKDGSIFWVHQRVSQELESSEPRLLVVCRDITEKRKLEEQLAHQATHDALTNLINRREFEHRLERLLKNTLGSAEDHVLCYLDLDQFKIINDTCGHIAGDELLRQIASLLEGHIRARDTLARLGGDEFAIIMEHCPIDKAIDLAEKIRSTIENFRFHWRSRRFSIGVSIGVVPMLEGYSPEAALSMADSACYAAKEQGRNRIHVYHTNDEAMASQVEDMRLAAGITEALERDQFNLYAQPIRSLDDNAQGDRFEILLRMQGDDQAIRPGGFMPVAERFNLSTKIDYWVLDHVINWFGANPEALERLDLCSINLSALSLCDDGFQKYVLTRLKTAPIPHSKLCFEITETAAISNLNQAVLFIKALRAAGCHFALDDFGSGLSSLAYLKELPVDMIKIDGEFIRNITKNEIDLVMVRSIAEIARKMGKKTTAEYVESEEALDLLKEIGVDFVQGYFLGSPRPLEFIANPVDPKSSNVVFLNP